MKTEEQPRRIRMDKWCEAEHAIYIAQQSIERMQADTRLTEAQTLLSKAQSLVADVIDNPRNT